MKNDGCVAPEAFRQACVEAGLELSPERERSLGRYLFALLDENQRVNLTAIRDEQSAWMRHIFESLLAIPHINPGQNLVDIGTGGGLPGLPVAIWEPQCPMTLVEATGKKTRFLENTKCVLNLPQVAVVNQRVETLGHDAGYREQFDVVLARAVGSLAELVELGMPLLRVGGCLLAYKGGQAPQEIDQASNAMKELHARLEAVHNAPCPGRDASVLVEIRKLAHTPGRYPRRPGVPKKTPL